MWCDAIWERPNVSWIGPIMLLIPAWKQKFSNTQEGWGGEGAITSLPFSLGVFTSTVAVSWQLDQGWGDSYSIFHSSALTLCLRKWFHDLLSYIHLKRRVILERRLPHGVHWLPRPWCGFAEYLALMLFIMLSEGSNENHHFLEHSFKLLFFLFFKLEK